MTLFMMTTTTMTGRLRPRALLLALLTPWPVWQVLLFAAAIMAMAPASAAAQASLETASASNKNLPSTLQEAQYTLHVDVRGPIAMVETRQVLVNAGQDTEQAIYTFSTPIDAAVVGAEVRLGAGSGKRNGQTTTMVVVDADAAITPAPNPGDISAAPDTALLRLVARDAPGINGYSPYAAATYELRVFPIGSKQSVSVTTRWTAPLRYVDGRLVLRIPGRGNAANLVRESVELTLTPPQGARGFAAVHGGGKLLGKQIKRAQFTAPTQGDIVIEAMPDFAGRAGAPVLSFAATPLAKDLGVLSLSLLAPLPSGQSTLSYERMLLIVDVSSSLGEPGLAAAKTLADAMLSRLPAAAAVEMITFDRQAQQTLGGFRENSHKTRKELLDALRPGALRNGSDLGAALELGRRALVSDKLEGAPKEGFERGERASTLVVLLSDGLTPLDLSAKSAVDRISAEVLSAVEILAVTLVPDTAPLPDITTGVLAELAYKTPGRPIAVRYGEVQARAQNLAYELTRPAPLRNIELELDGAALRGIELPHTIEPGQGAIAIGFYRGLAPKKLAITGMQRNVPVRFAAVRDQVLGKTGVALALAAADLYDVAPVEGVPEGPAAGGNRIDESVDLAQAKRLFLEAARQASVATRYSSIVALNKSDRFAADRLAQTAKWGPAVYFRMPTPAERAPGYQFRTYKERTQDGPAENEHRRTGMLDRNIIERLITTFVVPKARVCYEAALRKNHGLKGSLIVVIEIARGEVQSVQVDNSTFPSAGIEACVIDAAYAIQVPRVALGDDVEVIGVARYPLTFRKKKDQSEVSAAESELDAIFGNSGKAPAGDPDPGPGLDDKVDTADPLDGAKAPGSK